MSYNNMNNIGGPWMQDQFANANMLPVTFNGIQHTTDNPVHHYAPGQIPYGVQAQYIAQNDPFNMATLPNSQQPHFQTNYTIFNGMSSAMVPQNENSNDPFVGSNPMMGGGSAISDEEMDSLILEAQSSQQLQFNQMAMNYPPQVDQRSTILHNNQQSQSQPQLDDTNSEPEEQPAVITPPRTPRRKGNGAMARSIRNGRRTDKACDACKNRKVKCDKTPEGCRRCAEMGQVCQETTNGITRDRTAISQENQLRSQNLELTQLVEQLQASASSNAQQLEQKDDEIRALIIELHELKYGRLAEEHLRNMDKERFESSQ